MNASVLLLSSALLAGAEPAPVAGTPIPAAPAVAAAPITGITAGCGCSAPVAWASCEPACERAGLFDRLRARFAARRQPRCQPACAPAPCCAPAPLPAPCCGTPVFTGFTTSCADPCDRGGLLDRLRARFHGSRHCDACSVGYGTIGYGAGPVGCAPALGTVLPATPATGPGAPVPAGPPVNMPPPNVPKTDPPKTEAAAPVPADSGRVPVLGGTSGKY